MIWYTTQHRYTPDLVLDRLIVEVEGKVHGLPWVRTPDRIRRRALEAMGYTVLRVKNSDIEKCPDKVAEEIIQRYYEVCEGIDRNTKVIEIRPPSSPEVLPPEIDGNIEKWCIRFNSCLADEKWTTNYFRNMLADYDSRLTTNQAAIDRFMLILFGLNLKTAQSSNALDFEHSSLLFGKSIQIMEELFGLGGAIGMKNMLNISAPNFFKNLVFIGGPKVKPRIVSIESNDTLESHIDEFNLHFSKHGILVDKHDVVIECCEELTESLGKGKRLQALAWLQEVCSKY